MNRLDGKVAIVTGAARGIGRAVALKFAAERARVVVDDIDDSGGLATVSAISASGSDAAYVHADVSDAAQVQTLMDKAIERFGRLDVLVNNAICSLDAILRDDWRPVLDVCLIGTDNCCQAALPLMKQTGGGAIVNISSINAYFVWGGARAYSAAKAGVISLTQGLAVNHGREGIRANAICPGTIATETWEPIRCERPDYVARLAEKYPLGRIGQPNEVANAAAFLASDEASFITGAVLAVDGGLTAGLYEMRQLLH